MIRQKKIKNLQQWLKQRRPRYTKIPVGLKTAITITEFIFKKKKNQRLFLTRTAFFLFFFEFNAFEKKNKKKTKNSLSLIFFKCRGNSWKEKKLKPIIKFDLCLKWVRTCVDKISISFFCPQTINTIPL